MKIVIYGTGCKKCKQLFANAEQAVRLAGVEAEVTKVEQVADIVQAGVMFTPALAIDGQVKAAGRVLPPEKIADLLRAAAG